MIAPPTQIDIDELRRWAKDKGHYTLPKLLDNFRQFKAEQERLKRVAHRALQGVEHDS